MSWLLHIKLLYIFSDKATNYITINKLNENFISITFEPEFKKEHFGSLSIFDEFVRSLNDEVIDTWYFVKTIDYHY